MPYSISCSHSPSIYLDCILKRQEEEWSFSYIQIFDKQIDGIEIVEIAHLQAHSHNVPQHVVSL